MRIAEREGIGFVSGKGKHKPGIQKLYREKGAENSVDEGALSKIQTRGFCALK